MAIAYLVAGWLLIEMSSVALEAFAAPSWVPRAVAVLLAVGFPLALFFAWAFEVTPEGIQRESEVDRSKSTGHVTARRLDVISIVLLLAAMGLFLSEPLWRDRQATQAPVEASTSDVQETAPEESEAPEQDLGIAVLPFENLSANEDNVYFAGGVHEEVLTNLSRIPDLRVISRTSMIKIAQTDLDVRAMGQRLGVSHLLEGSVRRSGDRVRVTVQLIDAASDEHIWSENFDRTLDDIFAIQSEIALKIAERLKTELSPSTVAAIGERPTESEEAYQLYLRAAEHAREWRGADSYRPMIPLLERAIELDPEFLRARARLVTAYGRLHWLGVDEDGAYRDKAREALDELKVRWPERFETTLAEAAHTYTVERDYERVLALLMPLLEQWPNEVELVSFVSSSLKRLGRKEQFLEMARHWLALEPESSTAWVEVSFALDDNGQLEESASLLKEAAQRFPDDNSVHLQVIRKSLRLGHYQEVLEIADRMRQLDPDITLLGLEATAIYRLKGIEALLERFEEVTDEDLESVDDYLIRHVAMLMLHAGYREDRAREMLSALYAKLNADIDEHGAIAPQMLPDLAIYGASIAALLDERKEATRLLKLAEENPDSEVLARAYDSFSLAVIEAVLGMHEAAWKRLEPVREDAYAFREIWSPLREWMDLGLGDFQAYKDYLERIGEAPPSG